MNATVGTSSQHLLSLSTGPTPSHVLTYDTVRKAAACLDDLHDFTSDQSREAMTEFYTDVYQSPDLAQASKKVVTAWVASGKNMTLVRNAFHDQLTHDEPTAVPSPSASSAQVSTGDSPLTEAPPASTDDTESTDADKQAFYEQTLSSMRSTRSQRWERLADKLHIPTPTHFHAFRGVRGQFAIDAVLDSWKNKASFTTIPHRELTSWSLDREQAERFAEGAEAAVIYEADLPMAETVMDKWADGRGFITLAMEQQEIVVGAPENTLSIPSDQVTVVYQGETWHMADADRLLQRLESRS
jgi:hypothetical protein